MKSLETERGFEIKSAFFYSIWGENRVRVNSSENEFELKISKLSKAGFLLKMTIFGYLKMDSFFEIEIYLKMFDNEMVY